MKKQQEVYVLLRDSMSYGESSQNVQVFSKLENAKEQMQKEFDAELNDWETWCQKDQIIKLHGERTMSVSECGFWDKNHVLWVISKQVVK